MTEKELMRILQSDDSDKQYDAAREELAKELEKPLSSQDFDRVDALIQTIEHINGEEYASKDITEQGIASLNQRIARERRNRIKIVKWAAACACAFILVSNIWSYNAYGMNAFSAAYQILKGGLTIDFSKAESSVTESGNPYKEEMEIKCQEYNIDALVPSYIPTGFIPTDNYGKGYNGENETTLYFCFKKKEIKLNIQITRYFEMHEIPPIGIASDHYNITEQMVNDTIVYISKEEQQYTAAFMVDDTQYVLAADGVVYDECYQVLISMMP